MKENRVLRPMRMISVSDNLKLAEGCKCAWLSALNLRIEEKDGAISEDEIGNCFRVSD